MIVQYNLLQTNDKAEAVSELDTLRRRQKAAEEGDGKGGGEMGALRGEVSALREAVKERDRAVEQLKSQMKYYVAFAENSLQGRATPVTSREEDMETEKSKMEEELKEARVRNNYFEGQKEHADEFHFFPPGADPLLELPQL